MTDETIVNGEEVELHQKVILEDSTSADEDPSEPSSPCRQNSASTQKTAKYELNNGLFTTIMFLIKCNLGTGVLGMAIATDATGWVIGLFGIVFFAILSGMTFLMVGDFVMDFRRFLARYSPRCNASIAHQAEGHWNCPKCKDVATINDPNAPQLPDKEISGHCCEVDCAQDLLAHDDGDNKKFATPQRIMSVAFPGKEWLYDCMLMITSAGASIPYFQIAGNLGSQLLVHHLKVEASVDSHGKVEQYNEHWRTWLIIICALFWYPFAMVVNIARVTRFINIFGIIGIVYSVIVAMVKVDFDSHAPTHVWPASGVDLLAKLPSFVFAYGCHFVLFQAYNEMGSNAKPKKIATAATTSMTFNLMLYLVSAIFTYITFGTAIKGNYLDNFAEGNQNKWWLWLGQLLLLLAVSTSIPSFQHIARDSVLNLIGLPKARFADTLTILPWREGSSIKLPAFLWRGLTGLVLSAICTTIAITVHDVSIMMSIVGLLGNNFDAFLMPPAIFLSLYASPARRVLMEKRMWEVLGPGKKVMQKPEGLLTEQPKWKIYTAWFSVVMCFSVLGTTRNTWPCLRLKEK